MTKKKALERFEYWYAKAKTMPEVMDKVAWALYKTWREANVGN